MTKSTGNSVTSSVIFRDISPVADIALEGLWPAKEAREYIEVNLVASFMFSSVIESSM